MLHFLIPVWYSAALTYFSWCGCWDNPIFQLSCILFFLSYLPQPSPSLWKHLMVIFFFSEMILKMTWNKWGEIFCLLPKYVTGTAGCCRGRSAGKCCNGSFFFFVLFFFLSRYLLLLIFTWVLCRYFFFVVILVLDWWVTLLVMQSLKRSC